MTTAEVFTWVLTPVILAAFILSYTFLMLSLDKKEKLLIESGLRDAEIQEFYGSTVKKKETSRLVGGIIQIVLLVFFAVIVFFAIYTAAFSNDFPLFGSQMKVCGSNSMASVNERNADYIKANKLKNRFAVDDILIIKDLPKEENLKLYDIVTYKDKKTKRLIIHRIISINETDGVKTYTMRGDANPVSDAAKISYSDMRGIYRGKRLKGAGAFVRFIQSGFGIISIGTCIYICVIEQVLFKRIETTDKKRLEFLIAEMDRKSRPVVEVNASDIEIRTPNRKRRY